MTSCVSSIRALAPAIKSDNPPSREWSIWLIDLGREVIVVIELAFYPRRHQLSNVTISRASRILPSNPHKSLILIQIWLQKFLRRSLVVVTTDI